MDKTGIISGLLTIGYLVAPFVSAILLLTVTRTSTKEYPPVKSALLRAPGESFRRKILFFDENVMQVAVIITAVPWLIVGIVVWVIPSLGKEFEWPGFYFSALVTFGAMALTSLWVYYHVLRRRRYVAGYFGERAVGEELDKLPEGYHVFHNFPVTPGIYGQDLDHIVVGPTGVFVIETKMQRKRRARKNFAVDKVFYDGRQLIWPWAEDTHGLQQATNEAEWLTKWIRQMTGLDLAARPVLALPGWWVETRTPGPVAVHNPKNLPSYILGKGTRTLDPQQIDLIARQLDSRCRDVRD